MENSIIMQDFNNPHNDRGYMLPQDWIQGLKILDNVKGCFLEYLVLRLTKGETIFYLVLN